MEDASNGNKVVASGTVSNGSVTLSVPAGTLLPGTHNLIAVYGGDANFAASQSATYAQVILASPTVTGITPTSGPAGGGTSVIINGTGFTGATGVDFGSTPASSFTVNSAGTQITVLDPAGSGTVDVTVIGPGGTSAASVADQFTYTGVSLPAWLSLSGGGQVVWNAAAQTLEIQSGTATIVADPNEVRFNSGAGDDPVVTVDSGAKLEVAPTDGSLMVHIGGLTLNSGAPPTWLNWKRPRRASCPTASMSPTTMPPTMRRWSSASSTPPATRFSPSIPTARWIWRTMT